MSESPHSDLWREIRDGLEEVHNYSKDERDRYF